MTTTAVPATEVTRSSARRWLAPAGTVVTLGALTAYTALRDPYQPGFFPGCLFLAGTGHYCPGCGGLRATHELLHGNLAGALDMNPVVTLVILPLMALGMAWWLLVTAGVRVPTLRLSTAAAWALPALLGVFWVTRNIPALEPYLAP